MFYFYYLYVRMLYIPFDIFQMNQSTTSMGYLPLEWQPAMNRLSFTPHCFFFFLVFWSGFLFLFPFPSAFFNFYFYKKLYIYIIQQYCKLPLDNQATFVACHAGKSETFAIGFVQCKSTIEIDKYILLYICILGWVLNCLSVLLISHPRPKT